MKTITQTRFTQTQLKFIYLLGGIFMVLADIYMFGDWLLSLGPVDKLAYMAAHNPLFVCSGLAASLFLPFAEWKWEKAIYWAIVFVSIFAIFNDGQNLLGILLGWPQMIVQ